MSNKRHVLSGAVLLIGALINAARAEAPTAAPTDLFSPPSLVGSPMDPAKLLAAQASLGYRLVAELAKEKLPGANFVASPASLLAVFSLLETGASKGMRRALHTTFGFGRATQAVAAADFEAVRGSVSGLVKSGDDGPLSFANAVFFDPAAQPYKATVGGLIAAGADVAVKDLSNPEVIKQINDWVRAQTRGLIPSVLDQPLRKGGLVALNALYFRDRWQTPFDPRQTDAGKFQTVDGRTLDVSMMHSPAGELLFRRDDRFVAVDLPYASAGFSLVVVTTKDAPVPADEFAKAADWLTGASFTASKGQLVLPRFALEGSNDLLHAVDSLGLRRARRSSTALIGLAPTRQVIAQVLQKTVIKVDEEGTEAAAATAATTDRSFTADFVKMTVNKPFLFALRDQKSGFVLLTGYVGDPTGGTTAAEAKATAQ